MHVAVEAFWIMLVGLSDRPVCLYELTHVHGRADGRKVITMLRYVGDALRVMGGIPQRRVWLLQRVELHRNIAIMVVLSCKRQPLLSHSSNQDRHGLVENRAGLSGINPEIVDFIGRDAATDP